MSTAFTPEIVSSALPQVSAASFLNLRQKSFIDNYIECKVLWRAAELAGYNGNQNTLAQTANDLLKVPKVRAYYEERLQEMHLSSSEVLAEIAIVGRYDVITNPTGPVRATDKLKALELAGRYHKLFSDKSDTDSTFSAADIDRLGQSLLNAMIEASARMRQAQGGGPGPVDQQQLGPATSTPIGTVDQMAHQPLDTLPLASTPIPDSE
jgi:hypothetical protein